MIGPFLSHFFVYPVHPFSSLFLSLFPFNIHLSLFLKSSLLILSFCIPLPQPPDGSLLPLTSHLTRRALQSGSRHIHPSLLDHGLELLGPQPLSLRSVTRERVQAAVNVLRPPCTLTTVLDLSP